MIDRNSNEECQPKGGDLLLLLQYFEMKSVSTVFAHVDDGE